MSDKYHVDVYEYIGNMERNITLKYESFESAYNVFNMHVDIQRSECKNDAWSVSLFDMEGSCIKLSLSNTDFE
jgi:hypothetical protein|nr:MAG TPA: hypothetical protein [Caudoviricetes sp.]